MNKENQLDQYIQYGISGVPELKKSEKEYYLGEFEERVVLAVKQEALYEENEKKKIEDIIKNNSSVDKLIVNSIMNDKIRIQYMKMSKTYQKEFKIMEGETPVGLILASKTAL